MKNNKNILSGIAHSVPSDLKSIFLSDSKLLQKWNDLTPLARNEWICWVISVKKQETMNNHIDRLVREINQGKKRPCCWIGCIHRKDKKISPSVKHILKLK